MAFKFNQHHFGLSLLLLAGFTLGALNLEFGQNGSLEFASHNMNSSSATSAIYPDQSVAFPSSASGLNEERMEQSELLVNPQADQATCQITELTGPLGILGATNICDNLPDLCWTTTIATINRESDLTCAQAFRAAEILKERNNRGCEPQQQSLTTHELADINNTLRYPTTAPASNEEGLPLSDPRVKLADMDSISLEGSCRCNYSSSNPSADKFKLPALEQHCRAHFGEIYR